MSLTTDLNGTFSLAELNRLKFPVAWNGTKDAAEGQAEEEELGSLVNEAIEQLQECYNTWELEEGQELEITIKGGEIGEVVIA